MDYYSLMRNFWDYAFENPEIIKPNHCAVFCYAVEHCNRLGWKVKFGFPTEMAMNAVGISSYNTYKKTLNELIELGFITLIKKSENQFQSCVIALSKFDKSLDKSLDKSIINHLTNQSDITEQINDSIIRPIYQSTNKQINQSITENKNQIIISELKNTPSWLEAIQRQNKINEESVFFWLDAFGLKLSSEMNDKYSKKDFAEHFARWLPIELKKIIVPSEMNYKKLPSSKKLD